MLGVLLVLGATLFGEVSESVGKHEVVKGNESFYTMGFLSTFWTTLWFLLIIVGKGHFLFSLASLPTFIPRLLLELILAHVAILAVIKADRSTFGFFRIITIPLLLVVDIILGYHLSAFQLIGILLITIVIFLLFINGRITKKGIGYVLFTAVVSVITITLYKYDISHFNSVEAEQATILLAITIYFFFGAIFSAKENPFVFLKKRIFFVQSMSSGIAGLVESFAYLFAPASVIMAVKRSCGISWAILSGFYIFKEKSFLVKFIYLMLLTVGIILLIF